MRLEEIIIKLDEALKEQHHQYPNDRYVETNLSIKNIDISVIIDSYKGVEVSIINGEYTDRSYPNLEDYIAENIIKWDDLDDDDYDEWDDHGFASEADYMRYKFG